MTTHVQHGRLPGNFIDLRDRRFGCWSVVDYRGQATWQCKCDCGEVRDVNGSSLRAGRTKSCGRCLRSVPATLCAAEQCGKPALSSRIAYCKMHYSRLQRGSKDGLAPSRANCVQCGRSLKGRQQTTYCSHQCCVRHMRGTPEVRTCLSCGKAFPTWDRGGFCSPRCRRDGNHAWAHRKRAKMRGSGAERFSRREIFERDGWRCQLCGKKTRRRVNRYHPQAPTLDHIIPIARGGSHTRANSQCAHRRCNLRKHTAIRGQMRLFG